MELSYEPLDLAVIIRSLNLEYHDQEKLLNDLYTYDRWYLLPNHRGDKETFYAAVMEEVEKIGYRISYDNLSNSEKEELNKAIHRIILDDEKKYVNFFNRQNRERMQLHFLDGISRKAGTKIVAQREKKDFESFEDINKRISFIDDSEELIFKRVFYELSELKNTNDIQCYLFVNIKHKQGKKLKEPQLDDFEKSDKFFIEKLKKEGLLEKSGKRIR
mgnify:CR=1 FL=1